MADDIIVYRDWNEREEPAELGLVHARPGRTGEIFDFAFDEKALADPKLTGISLDPRVSLFAGRQYPSTEDSTFGFLSDASPDRWGRTLMQRRLDRRKRAGELAPSARLKESDFLLGVHDPFRSGALRFKREHDGPFLDNDGKTAAPPFVRLRELEAASRAVENDVANDAPQGDVWLRMLLVPGASLGGARPKATVVDPQEHLWIAKFPSVRDDWDAGAWEFVLQKLAERCAIRVPQNDARCFASDQHTFLVRRFDRTDAGGRIHFASAMTLTGRRDGDDASTGASYLELAEVIVTRGSDPKLDLKELWSRILFNVLVSNTDDHLRNHGFLLEPGRGWRLSPAYDMNPAPDSSGLSLNITEADNALDLDLVQSVAESFRVKPAERKEIEKRFIGVVRGWREVAASVGIGSAERARMAPAFALADGPSTRTPL